MWNGKRSIILSKICVAAFFIMLSVIIVSAPWLVGRILSHSRRGLYDMKNYFFVTVYVGSLPAGILLKCLYDLLKRIDKGVVFVRKNVGNLRLISWCCFVGSLIAFVSMTYYVPWVLVGVAAAFMGLIVRVVKNVIARAVELQDDADLTI